MECSESEKTEDILLRTGDKNFELLFGGGIRVDPEFGTSILIEGSAGVGKTTLALQLVTNAIQNLNFVCLYYIFEQTQMEIIKMIANFGWLNDVQDLDNFFGKFNWLELIEGSNKIRTLNIFHSTNPDRNTKSQFSQMFDCQLPYVKAKYPDKKIILVIDSIGALRSNENEREFFSKFICDLRKYKAVAILISEKESGSSLSCEYLTNVVLRLERKFFEEIPRSLIKIIKTRNQKSYVGPHEFEILSSSNDAKDKKITGFVVYPSLQTVSDIKDKGLSKNHKERATFGIPLLDDELGEKESDGTIKAGMEYGQSLLIKGEPGSYKTKLSIQFLENDNLREALFISWRTDKNALRGLCNTDILEFIDARNPFQTPSQVMTLIRKKVLEKTIRRVVIFGIGMLDTLPVFKAESLTFLQVLIAFFKSNSISGIFVDWPQETQEKSGLGKPTALTIHFLAGEIEINKSKTSRSLIVKRKNHRVIPDPKTFCLGTDPKGKIHLKLEELNCEE